MAAPLTRHELGIVTPFNHRHQNPNFTSRDATFCIVGSDGWIGRNSVVLEGGEVTRRKPGTTRHQDA